MAEQIRRNYHLMGWPALAVILLDQLSKWAVQNSLQIHESIPIINGFFNLVHVRNKGMAFGFMNRPDINYGVYLLVAASIAAIIFLMIWFFRLKQRENLTILALSLILGGAVGNLIDRVRIGEVIDFADFYVGQYHWPAFNVADSAIVVGAGLIAITLFFLKRRLD